MYAIRPAKTGNPLPGQPAAVWWVTLGVLLLFFSYFIFTGTHLPAGAGPDYSAHLDATRFIYRESRLAVLPNDEEKLSFSPYGTTRALRPPAVYLASALLARALPSGVGEPEQLFLLGSALLCALAVAAVFIAAAYYFANLWIGLLGAFLFGLLPQLTFIASYPNDDSGAILAGTLLIAALLMLYRWGLNLYTVATLGAIIGFTIANKFSSWLILPFVLLYALLDYRTVIHRFLRFLAAFIVPFLLFGGWWLLFNLYHYGPGDLLQFNVTEQQIEKHSTTPQYTSDRGFAAQGLGYRDLLIDNHKDFIGASFRSMIGHLDQLRLRLGWLQYGFYLPVALCGLGYYLLRAVRMLFFTATPRNGGDDFRRFVLETFLVAIIAFQTFMYVRFNLYHDIQVQGKYLLPAFFALLLLFLSALQAALAPLYERLSRSGRGSYAGFTRFVTLAGILATTAVHAHALKQYAIPFYYPPEIQIEVQVFKAFDLNRDDIVKGYQNMTLASIDGSWRIRVVNHPAHLMLKPEICRLFAPASLLKIRLRADHSDRVKLYLDDGEGFSEKTAVKARYKQGDNALLFGLKKSHCRRLLVEPMARRGEIVIEEISVAPVRIPLH